MEKGAWKPITLCQDGPLISHIFFFADNLLLFAKASLAEVENIKWCLDTFCSVFRSQLSMTKT